MGKKNAISPTRAENYALWYQNVVKSADMAETSDVRGCMVIKPWGYQIWENMRSILDAMFRKTGHKNAYFPLFIPKSYLEKEATHVDGFAKECAIVTHSRLEESDKDGKLIPKGKLTEELIIRPTSETIIGESFSKWIKSYRDLPLLINQWANVVRWEMRPRLFIRTSEFLWQEGHTVHETEAEALEHTYKILEIYKTFVEDYLAIPVFSGEKSESERFPGAKTTLCLEAMMQDRKALQMGTSHFLGQNFAKASNIKFQNKEKNYIYAWTTSWGVSTRLIGALIMAHSDDDGLVLPPLIAPSHVVFISCYKSKSEKKIINEYISPFIKKLSDKKIKNLPVIVELDDLDTSVGSRIWSWIKKGIPIRVEVGMKEVKENTFTVARRDLAGKEKIGKNDFLDIVMKKLDIMQKNIFNKAIKFKEKNCNIIDSKKDFYKNFIPKNKKNPEIHGSFVFSFWCGKAECEKKIKNDLSVTIRTIPFDNDKKSGKCINCGRDSRKRVLFAKAY